MNKEKEPYAFSDYLNDETKVSPEERELIRFESSLNGKMIEAREKRKLSQSSAFRINHSFVVRIFLLL